MSSPSAWQILGVKRGASKEQVRQAYRALAKQYHPDLCTPESRPEAELVFKQIAAAYNHVTQGTHQYPNHHNVHRKSASSPGQNGSTRSAPNQYSNGVLALMLAAPLLLTGVLYGRSSQNWQEQTWRTRGLLSPPHNPWLKNELRATEFSHRASPSSDHSAAAARDPTS